MMNDLNIPTDQDMELAAIMIDHAIANRGLTFLGRPIGQESDLDEATRRAGRIVA